MKTATDYLNGMMPEAVRLDADLTLDGAAILAPRGAILRVCAWGANARGRNVTYRPGTEPYGWNEWPADTPYLIGVLPGEAGAVVLPDVPEADEYTPLYTPGHIDRVVEDAREDAANGDDEDDEEGW
jgi:hypothetical protein